jgi:hypothetical protein
VACTLFSILFFFLLVDQSRKHDSLYSRRIFRTLTDCVELHAISWSSQSGRLLALILILPFASLQELLQKAPNPKRSKEKENQIWITLRRKRRRLMSSTNKLLFSALIQCKLRKHIHVLSFFDDMIATVYRTDDILVDSHLVCLFWQIA